MTAPERVLRQDEPNSLLRKYQAGSEPCSKSLTRRLYGRIVSARSIIRIFQLISVTGGGPFYPSY